MEKDLTKLPKSALIALLEKEQKAHQNSQVNITYLEAQVAQLQRLLFGQKRERFEQSSNQLLLPFAGDEAKKEEQEAVLEEKISYTRKKQSKPHPGRHKLPDNLPVEEIEIHPEGDLSQMTCIGKEITEELECIPEQFFIRRYIRYKYAPKSKEGRHQIGTLPSRVIDKGIPGASLLAMLLVNKYADHLPLYRQKQRFTRQDIQISNSTLNHWVKQSLEKLEILYDHLRSKMKSQGYLQADETPIKVLESEKKGACHQGYFWVYHDPIYQNVLFDYQPGRGQPAARAMLGDFEGYLQSDGYGVYEKFAQNEGVTHLLCWAHARRYFEKALDNDASRAQKALLFIQQLYQVERYCRDEKLSPERRKEYRLDQALPILNQMGKWLSEEVKNTLPRSTIGKAFGYAIQRWDELNNYLLDGYLEIDNNLTENAIRPIALGRKNYLFAGSHDAAQRSAVIYTFLAICKKHQVNPQDWLQFALKNVMDTSIQQLDTLLPQNFKPR